MDPYPPAQLLLLWMQGKLDVDEVITYLILIIIDLQEQFAALKTPPPLLPRHAPKRHRRH